jgi:replicative DNA helicase
MFLHRPDAEQTGEQIDSEIIVAKQRGGPTGTVTVYFEGSVTRYKNRYAR